MTASNHMTETETAEARAERIGHEADRWLVRAAEGPFETQEARAFNTWLLADPEHERRYRQGQAALREVAQMRNADDLDVLMAPSLYERITGAGCDAVDWLKARKMTIALPAAGAFLAASGALAIALLLPRDIANPSPIEPDFVTKIAEIREEILPDGTVVTLGAASAVDIQFTEQERRVALASGEAFFDVARDTGRPFIVVADNTLVRVLGTRFDVSLGSSTVDIAVAEGRVEVIQPEDGARMIAERDVKHVLTAGQQVAAAKTGRVRPVETIAPDNVAAWRRGELIWVDAPVADIIADLNRYSETRIILGERSYADLDYTFAFHTDDVARAASLLANALGLDEVRRPNGDILLHKAR